MTKLEKTVEALRRCIPADKFEKELAGIEKEEDQTSKSVDVLDKYFGNTVSPNKGKPTNSEFVARMGRAIRERLKEAQT